MLVFVQGAAEPVASSYVEGRDLAWFGEWRGQWVQWSGVGDALMRPVLVVEALELTQCVNRMILVPGRGAVQQLAPAGLNCSRR
jgi:hypothetical protein